MSGTRRDLEALNAEAQARDERARERFVYLRLNDAMDEYAYVDPAAITSIRSLPSKGGDDFCMVTVARDDYTVYESAETVLDTVERMLARR